jgi:hypothetical protein
LSCTIFYKGKLKDNNDLQCVLNIIEICAKEIKCEIIRTEYSIVIQFNQGKTEPLDFAFRDDRIDSFCKWNGTDEHNQHDSNL